MEASLIKRGDILRTNAISLTTDGFFIGSEIIVPGTMVKVVRKDKNGRCFCEVMPREDKNGAIYISVGAGQLNRA